MKNDWREDFFVIDLDFFSLLLVTVEDWRVSNWYNYFLSLCFWRDDDIFPLSEKVRANSLDDELRGMKTKETTLRWNNSRFTADVVDFSSLFFFVAVVFDCLWKKRCLHQLAANEFQEKFAVSFDRPDRSERINRRVYRHSMAGERAFQLRDELRLSVNISNAER